MSKDSNLSLVEASPSGEVDTKACTRCGKDKLLEEFGSYKHKTNGRRYPNSKCGECRKDSARDSNLLKKYGVTRKQYDEMASSQGNCCDVCGTHQSEMTRRLAVDHDHRTGAVRSLLCTQCNVALGQVDDSIERLNGLIQYLEKHS